MSKNNFQAAVLASTFSIVGFSFYCSASFAQNAIAPDKTLPVNTLVNFNSANKTYTITGGTQVGANQFHSFQELSVPTSNTAHFDNALTTTNVIGRVTGSNVSNIDGVLRTNGATNLYLVNPNGIIFGANAKLDIAGSFSASTANSIKFSDGSEFSATNPQAPSLLQVNMPLGLQYGKSNAGATISNSGNLAAGQDLVLNADKLDLQGTLRSGRDLTLQAQDSVKIRDTVTNPFVANSGRDLTIQGNSFVDIFALNNSLTQILSGRHLSLVSDGVISGDAHFLSGGNLSFLTTTGGVANFVSKYDPIIYANGDVTFGDYTGAALKVEATGSIETGNIRITSPDTSGAIPISDPDFVTLTTLPSVILRAGVTSVTSNIPQTTGGTTFSSTTLGNPAGSITFGSIDTSSSTGGDGGAIQLTAKGDIKSNGSFLNSSSLSYSGNAGSGGAISLSTITGNIALVFSPLIFFSPLNSSSFSDSGNTGNGGAISLSTITGNISLVSSTLNSSSFSNLDSGNGGAISLSTITGDISLNSTGLDSYSSSKSGNAGNGGAISLSTNIGNISLGSFVSSGSYSTSGNAGKGGAISLSTITGDISLNSSTLNSSSFSGSGNAGNGEAISLSTITGDISLNSSTLNSSSFSFSGSGNAGNGEAISLSIITGDISLNSSTLYAYSYSDSGKSGNGGGIILSAIKGNILGTDSSSIYSFSVANSPNSTSGAGGNVTLDAKKLINNMDLVTASSSGSAGKAIINGFADLTISGLQISTSKTVIIPNPFDPSKPIIFDFGTNGRSGDVTVTGLGSLTFDNTIINSATQGNDPAGNISITSPSLINFQNNSQIKSTTNSTGNAGNISFTTGNLLLTDGVKVSASTAGSGKAGDISVRVNNFTLTNGASIETKTSSSGDSGKIEVIVGNNLILVGAGTGLFADTTPESTGRGGSIFVDPPLVSITNGAGISVNSLGKGNGGNINIFADKFIFANNAFLRANTASGEGGNINLQIANIFFPRNNSSITATAAGTGNGGNITLSALFLVSLPSENNDIFANAFLGKGGNINITTQGIFGLAFRPRLTSLSDITASSDFGLQGSVTLNTPGVDPSQGLNTLPADIGDASKLVSQKCLADRQSSSFVITGRGGIPASPFDTISAANIPDHLGSISNQTASNNSNGITAESSNSPIPDRIVEAQGWMINAQGQILFIAEVPAIPATVWSSQPKCISVSK